MLTDEGAPLYEFDKEEWWDVMKVAVKSLRGQMTREEFEVMWSDLCEMKRRKQQQ